MDLDKVKSLLKSYPDFPKPGILFWDIHSVLRVPEARAFLAKLLVERYRAMNLDVIIGLESRGYYFASIVAHELNLPFVPVRKAGKLPGDKKTIAYGLEYGKAEIDIAVDSIQPGQRVAVIDDLMATGGTASAACSLISQLGGVIVEVHCLIELIELNGKVKLPAGTNFYSLLQL